MKHVPLSLAISVSLFITMALVSQTECQVAPAFKRVMVVILENTDYGDALAQPFLGELAKGGALLAQSYAVTHPSQPNYIALIAGTFSGVVSNDPVDLAWRHIGDLLEAQGKTWKVYAQAYPGNCFLGAKRGTYVRKHVPFLSFTNVQTSARRCANVVEASVLKHDIDNRGLPNYALYIPDMRNDGHATGIEFADRWLARAFGALIKDRAFMKDMLLVVTFDEARNDRGPNHIYTAFLGDAVRSGTVAKKRYDHYSFLRTIEDAFGLGTLGKNDASASPITGVWK